MVVVKGKGEGQGELTEYKVIVDEMKTLWRSVSQQCEVTLLNCTIKHG